MVDDKALCAQKYTHARIAASGQFGSYHLEYCSSTLRQSEVESPRKVVVQMKSEGKSNTLPVRPNIVMLVAAAILAAIAPAKSLFAQSGYQKPPKAVLDVLNAPTAPEASVSPTRDVIVLFSPERLPPIAEVSRPFARLGGLRIDIASNGSHYFYGGRNEHFVIKHLDGSEVKVSLPAGFVGSSPLWSADGKKFAVTRRAANSVELWVVDAKSGEAKIVPDLHVNGALMLSPCQWLAGTEKLLCVVVPAGRGAAPAAPRVPAGPRVQESFGKSAPVRTYEDLLENEHDAKLFDYYVTAQMVLVDPATGQKTNVGAPAIFASVEPAPDGEHLLVERIKRPYSYIVTHREFPRDIEVWNLAGKSVYKVTSRPLAEAIPIEGVPTGPRSFEWNPSAPATLFWVEALDDGDPNKQASERDKVMSIAAPFSGSPAEVTRVEKRFSGLSFGQHKDFAMVSDTDRDTKHVRTWFFDPQHPDNKKLVWDRNSQDHYGDPGRPVMAELPNGQSAILQEGNFIYLEGAGASPDGERPFIDRFDTSSLEATRIFQGATGSYESIRAVLSKGARSVLTRRESLTEPPNFCVRSSSKGGELAEANSLDHVTTLTKFADPTPQLRAIKKELVKYQRPDGVELSMTVYYPPDYKQGERRPAFMWAYPVEFTNASVAGQISGSPYHFTTIEGDSELFFLLNGYVVLENVTMPIVGDPETVNDTYVEQLVADAKAAIDKGADMGVIDPNRVGVGGHSYGAFMTANLLAHSDLFKAGVARSGAYNRTLTPFGFQTERRTFWQARDVYIGMSPFTFADKLKTPILLIHGEADDNQGTFPIQSDRMYRAIKGNGGSVRYVTLPDEAHGYSARESIEHVLWEMFTWCDRFVKNGESPNGAAGSH